jgi:subtilisin family serine protease
MANTPEVPTLIDWVNAMAPYATPIITGVVGYLIGRLNNRNNARLELARIKAEAQRTENALRRKERQEKVNSWLKEIQVHTLTRTDKADTRDDPAFLAFKFSNSGAYLTLRPYLSGDIRKNVEVQPVVAAGEYYRHGRPSISIYMSSLELRQKILDRIGELKEEWGLA